MAEKAQAGIRGSDGEWYHWTVQRVRVEGKGTTIDGDGEFKLYLSDEALVRLFDALHRAGRFDSIRDAEYSRAAARGTLPYQKG